MRLTRLCNRLLPLAPAGLCAGLLLCLLPALQPDLNRPASRLVKSALAQGSTHFAIADFDGDLRPDLAMIRVSRDGAHDAQYSLELQFSSGSRAPIGLTGPAGGLEVYPQDVNGDQFADLVITSVVDSDFVAILVNDGKGNFTQVDRAAYPSVGRRPHTRLLGPVESSIHEFAVGQSQKMFGDEVAYDRWEHVPQVSFALAPDFAQISLSFLVFHTPGRAPPQA
jgi:hypothetical protein